MRYILLFLVLLPFGLFAQQKFNISGTVNDSQTGEALFGATVYVPELKSGTSAAVDGSYRISMPPGNYEITFNFLGYLPITKQINLQGNLKLDIELTADNMQLQTVEINAEKANSNVSSIEVSVSRMDAKQIKEIPQFMGETDIIRSVQLLPGVSTVGEGASGFNVRGGNIDQNLILLDQASIFNSSHLFGFFSVFNADAVENIALHKGGIPARYGGRLSSVLDVKQKIGNAQNFSGSGGIGLVSSRFALEGPIIKNKMSFIVAGRRSYGDIFLPLFGNDLGENTIYFYDLNAKLNYIVNDKNRVYFSAYMGNDVFRFGDSFQTTMGSTTATLNWNHIINSKLSSSFAGVYSKYSYTLGVPQGEQAFQWDSQIENYNLKTDFSFFPNVNNTIEFGASAIYYNFVPGTMRGKSDESIFNELKVQEQYALESGLYISNEQSVTDQLTLKYGLRYSNFANYGARNEYLYPNDIATSKEDIIDTVFYDKGDVISNYGGFEPRLAVNYTFNPRSSIKASYNLMRQYLHLVSNTTAATPLDIWMPASKYIKPATVQQVTLGYFRNFADNTYELSVEGYYKDYKNLLDYKNGAELLLNDALETELLHGDGRAYGLEMQLSKVKGDFTGWISYTLSRSELQVPGINNGEFYPSNYDKLHDISVVANYNLNSKWKFSGIFAFMSGRPVTYPDSRYTYGGITVPNYSSRNGARAPLYHRLDLSATLNLKPKTDKKLLFFINRPDTWEHSLTFSIYNVYGRKNAYSVYFKQNEDNPEITEAYQLSIFGSAIPGITYNFNF